MKATLTEINGNKTHNFNLMNLTRMKGWSIEKGDETGIYILKGGDKIAFNIVNLTTREAVLACRFIQDEELNAMRAEKQTTMNITKMSGVFGHMHEYTVRRMAKHMNIKLPCGTLAPCKHCAKSKGKQKNVSKESQSKKATDVCKQYTWICQQ